MFAPAVKTESKLRLAIAGPSGSGKTYTALAVATALADGGKVAVLDTEHGSASKYADLFAFDVLNESAPFHPDKVTAAINDAGRGGYAVLILDSMSHFWNGPGGMTDIVDDIARRMKSPNSFAAWKDGTPIQQKMIEAIVSAPLHIIATMRSKQDYILETDERGKQRPRKVGMAPIQRDGFEYEFDVFMDMDNDNTGMIAKTRCPALTNGVFRKPGADVANILRDWLHGAPPAPIDPLPAAILALPNSNLAFSSAAGAAKFIDTLTANARRDDNLILKAAANLINALADGVAGKDAAAAAQLWYINALNGVAVNMPSGPAPVAAQDDLFGEAQPAGASSELEQDRIYSDR